LIVDELGQARDGAASGEGESLQTEVNPDRSIVATCQVLRGASFVMNDAAQVREAARSTASR